MCGSSATSLSYLSARLSSEPAFSVVETDSAVISFGLFATKITGIGLCYAKAVGVNLILPPDYGPDGKAIRQKF